MSFFFSLRKVVGLVLLFGLLPSFSASQEIWSQEEIAQLKEVMLSLEGETREALIKEAAELLYLSPETSFLSIEGKKMFVDPIFSNFSQAQPFNNNNPAQPPLNPDSPLARVNKRYDFFINLFSDDDDLFKDLTEEQEKWLVDDYSLNADYLKLKEKYAEESDPLKKHLKKVQEAIDRDGSSELAVKVQQILQDRLLFYQMLLHYYLSYPKHFEPELFYARVRSMKKIKTTYVLDNQLLNEKKADANLLPGLLKLLEDPERYQECWEQFSSYGVKKQLNMLSSLPYYLDSSSPFKEQFLTAFFHNDQVIKQLKKSALALPHWVQALDYLPMIQPKVEVEVQSWDAFCNAPLPYQEAMLTFWAYKLSDEFKEKLYQEIADKNYPQNHHLQLPSWLKRERTELFICASLEKEVDKALERIQGEEIDFEAFTQLPEERQEIILAVFPYKLNLDFLDLLLQKINNLTYLPANGLPTWIERSEGNAGNFYIKNEEYFDTMKEKVDECLKRRKKELLCWNEKCYKKEQIEQDLINIQPEDDAADLGLFKELPIGEQELILHAFFDKLTLSFRNQLNRDLEAKNYPLVDNMKLPPYIIKEGLKLASLFTQEQSLDQQMETNYKLDPQYLDEKSFQQAKPKLEKKSRKLMQKLQKEAAEREAPLCYFQEVEKDLQKIQPAPQIAPPMQTEVNPGEDLEEEKDQDLSIPPPSVPYNWKLFESCSFQRKTELLTFFCGDLEEELIVKYLQKLNNGPKDHLPENISWIENSDPNQFSWNQEAFERQKKENELLKETSTTIVYEKRRYRLANLKKMTEEKIKNLGPGDMNLFTALSAKDQELVLHHFAHKLKPSFISSLLKSINHGSYPLNKKVDIDDDDLLGDEIDINKAFSIREGLELPSWIKKRGSVGVVEPYISRYEGLDELIYWGENANQENQKKWRELRKKTIEIAYQRDVNQSLGLFNACLDEEKKSILNFFPGTILTPDFLTLLIAQEKRKIQPSSMVAPKQDLRYWIGVKNLSDEKIETLFGVDDIGYQNFINLPVCIKKELLVDRAASFNTAALKRIINQDSQRAGKLLKVLPLSSLSSDQINDFFDLQVAKNMSLPQLTSWVNKHGDSLRDSNKKKAILDLHKRRQLTYQVTNFVYLPTHYPITSSLVLILMIPIVTYYKTVKRHFLRGSQAIYHALFKRKERLIRFAYTFFTLLLKELSFFARFGYALFLHSQADLDEYFSSTPFIYLFVKKPKKARNPMFWINTGRYLAALISFSGLLNFPLIVPKLEIRLLW